jgi:triacylglycerol lipase
VHRLARLRRPTAVGLLCGLALGALAVPARAAPRRAPADPDPVVLVHGFDGSAASWKVMIGRLRDAGYPAERVEAISYDSYQSNVTTAQQLAGAVDALRARTGARKVDIVSHSMGAISARYYLEELGGADSVDALVTLGGVNDGTIWGYGCYVFESCKEMVPGSDLLGRLDRDASTLAATRLGAWWSPCDTAIVPVSNAQLVDARNTETRCLGHSDLKSDPTVFKQVLAFLG